MSPIFIKAFKAKVKCPQCSADKLNGYSICSKHLLKARFRWRRWSKSRYHQGLCHSCDQRHIPGQQRCMPHTIKNRKYCWEWSYNKYHARKRDGLCVMCPIGVVSPTVDRTVWCYSHREQAREKNRKYHRAHSRAK